MKLKLAPFFRNSSQAQKDEETINRQIDGFELMWERLSKDFNLFQRRPGEGRKAQYFIDEAFNLETWNEETSFHELMILCEAGEINAIYVSEGDRLFRSRSNALRGRILDIIRENKIQIITKSGEISQSSLAMEIISAVGAEDKRAFMRKCHDAKITRLKDEKRPPTGKMPFCLHWDKREKKWSLVENEVALLRCAVGLSIGKVFDEMPQELQGVVHLNPDGLNDKQVAKELSRLGFSKQSFYKRINLSKFLIKRTNSDMNSSAIEKMFRDDNYRGFLRFSLLDSNAIGSKHKQPSDWKTYRIEVPRVLSDEDWDQLQAKRSSRRKWAKRNQKHDYLCKDLLVCMECGIPLAARPRYIERYIRSRNEVVKFDPFLYYTCARKQKVSGFRCSSGKHHSVPIIDALVWDSLASMIRNPEGVIALFAAGESNDARLKRRSEIEKAVVRYQAEIDSFANRRKVANRLLASGVITEEDFKEQIGEINSQRKQSELDIANAQREIAALSQLPDMSDVIEKITTLNLTELTTFEQRRALMQSLLSKIQISNDGLVTIFLKSGVQWSI